MSPDIRYGLGDNPQDVSAVWLDSCGGDGTHPEVIFVGAIVGPSHLHKNGHCPACAGVAAARYERQEAAGEVP